MPELLIVGETIDGKLAGITGELLGIGRKLADSLGQKLSAVLIGSGGGNLAQQAVALGADKVYVVDNPAFKEYQTEPYLTAMQAVCQQAKPDILLLGQTSLGRDLAPRLAFRLGTGVSLDCINLAIDPQTKLMVQTKPVYGGNALADYVCESTRPQMATIRPKAMSACEPDTSRKGEVVPVSVPVDPSKIGARLVDRVKQEVAGVKLEEAEVVVTGGRGIGGPEGFKDLEVLAKLLKGAMGASRPPCDSGWVPSTVQIGLTGKIVSPTLYIGIAVSGSSQHLAGCSGSKCIVAINRDPEANIFKIARFGVVGDYHQAVPAFIAKCKEILSS